MLVEVALRMWNEGKTLQPFRVLKFFFISVFISVVLIPLF